ncbi:MAG: hypothetical protein IK064_05480, partial [Clostridia bacterium]|nr:hypothetical protein [Clostridia bacterium]
GDYVLCAAAKAEDGYVAVLTKFMPFASSSILTAENEPMIVHISADGEITPIAGCEAPYSTFRVSSIAEYGGKIYISGYEFTGAKNGAFLDERSEIIPLLDELFADMETIMDPETGESTISSDMLTPRVAEIYTGKLLAIVPGSGTVEEVLSLDGAIGSTLSFTHEGKLLWNCESFASTFFSPVTSSFTIGGLCRVGQCVIEPGGSVDGGVFLIGAIVIYRR